MTEPQAAAGPARVEHLDTIQYEIDMLEYCHSMMCKNYWPDKPSYHLSLEGFLHHYRNLAEFFSNTGDLRANNPDVWAGQKRLTEKELASIQSRDLAKKYVGDISRYLSHCTKGRAIKSRAWNIIEIYDEMKPCLENFRKIFPVEKVSEVVVGATIVNATTSSLTRSAVIIHADQPKKET